MILGRLSRPPEIDVSPPLEKRSLKGNAIPIVVINKAEPNSPGLQFDQFKRKNLLTVRN